MKCILAFVLAAAGCAAADFATGQAARLVIGQSTYTRQEPGASQSLVGGISGLAYANDMLFVADSNRVGANPINHRVLIYRGISQLPGPADELVYTRRCPVCTNSKDPADTPLLGAATVLGQANFSNTGVNGNTTGVANAPATQSGLRTPTAIASDGRILAVADTDNNRVLIWNRIPTGNNAPADVVVGQPDFTRSSVPPGNVPNNKSMRGPQGVWLQDGKLFVADTQNHRVLIYNSVPTSNGSAADIVLGQPDFNTFVEPDLTQAKVNAQAGNMLNPVSVTSDGTRLYVTDLGHNRVLIWNSLPTRNQAPADVVLGQPDMNGALPNNSYRLERVGDKDVQRKVLCESNGTDTDGNPTYPSRCNSTLNFPRYALSDGQRLFVADGGNDRVLVYSKIPTQNGQPADIIIGQLGGQINQASDAADSLRTPLSLAWDGANLYVSDAFNRRITVYSTGEHNIPYTGVRNAASREIYAVGGVTVGGTIKEADEVTVKIADKEYKYKIVKDDTFAKIVAALVNLINAGAGDPKVFASENPIVNGIVLTSRIPGEAGNEIQYSVSTSENAVITAGASGATLSGGQDAAKIAPGTVVTILGENLSDASASAPEGEYLPDELAGAQVYFDGIRAPLFFVSPTQINAQIPFEVLDTTSLAAWVRTRRANGSVTVTTPVSVTIVPENPGIFAEEGNDPRPGVILHGSSQATGTVSVDGSVKEGEIATVTIEDRTYTYTVKAGDTLQSIRDALIELINQDPQVEAYPAGVFTRIRLRARVPGPEGNGIRYTARAPEGSQVILTATGVALCCANVAFSRVTEANPAVPGETIIVLATGLGLPKPQDQVNTGTKYRGGVNEPVEFVSSLAGGKTANVLSAGLQPGSIGIYEVHLELNSDLPTNPQTQLTIAQFLYVSNIVTIPVVNPNPPAPAAP